MLGGMKLHRTEGLEVGVVPRDEPSSLLLPHCALSPLSSSCPCLWGLQGLEGTSRPSVVLGMEPGQRATSSRQPSQVDGELVAPAQLQLVQWPHTPVLGLNASCHYSQGSVLFSWHFWSRETSVCEDGFLSWGWILLSPQGTFWEGGGLGWWLSGQPHRGLLRLQGRVLMRRYQGDWREVSCTSRALEALGPNFCLWGLGLGWVTCFYSCPCLGEPLMLQPHQAHVWRRSSQGQPCWVGHDISPSSGAVSPSCLSAHICLTRENKVLGATFLCGQQYLVQNKTWSRMGSGSRPLGFLSLNPSCAGANGAI